MSPQIIRITARRGGFRRCGIAHPARAVDHPADRFTAEELTRLMAEPELVVELVKTEGTDADDDGSTGGDTRGQTVEPTESTGAAAAVSPHAEAPGSVTDTAGPAAVAIGAAGTQQEHSRDQGAAAPDSSTSTKRSRKAGSAKGDAGDKKPTKAGAA